MKKVIEWGKLTWPEAEKAVRQMPACILPLGAIEAHGPHMTLDVDNGICTEQSRRICEETGIILLPTIPMGQVWSLYRFPGTLTLSYYTLIAVVRDMLRSLYDHGFRVIFIRSHHYGNVPAIKQAVRESYEEFMGKDVKFVILEERGAMRSVAEQIRTSPCAHPVFSTHVKWKHPKPWNVARNALIWSEPSVITLNLRKILIPRLPTGMW